MILFSESISLIAAIALAAVSFIASFMTASMGIGGGLTLVAAMATVMPPAALIPVHGVIQLGSNGGRAALLYRDIDWPTFALFTFGGLFGVAIGGSIVVALPGDALRLTLAAFIIYSVWAPKLRIVSSGRTVVVIVGAIASVVTMFVGATGMFVAALLSQRGFTPKAMVATQGICMTAQHTLKLIAFGILGFAFAEWLGLIALLLVSGFAGTYAGALLLNRLPARVFNICLKTMLTLLAINLIATVLGVYEAI